VCCLSSGRQVGSTAPLFVGALYDRESDKRDVRFVLLGVVSASYLGASALFAMGLWTSPPPVGQANTVNHRLLNPGRDDWVNVYEEGSTGSFSVHDSPARSSRKG
jgi:hypothetical protein